MKTYYRLADIPPAGGRRPGTAVALGFFDGVHTGHRAVIDAAVDWAKHSGLAPAAFSFTLPAGHAMKGGRLITEEESKEIISEIRRRQLALQPMTITNICNYNKQTYLQQIKN